MDGDRSASRSKSRGRKAKRSKKDDKKSKKKRRKSSSTSTSESDGKSSSSSKSSRSEAGFVIAYTALVACIAPTIQWDHIQYTWNLDHWQKKKKHKKQKKAKKSKKEKDDTKKETEAQRLRREKKEREEREKQDEKDKKEALRKAITKAKQASVLYTDCSAWHDLNSMRLMIYVNVLIITCSWASGTSLCVVMGALVTWSAWSRRLWSWTGPCRKSPTWREKRRTCKVLRCTFRLITPKTFKGGLFFS